MHGRDSGSADPVTTVDHDAPLSAIYHLAPVGHPEVSGFTTYEEIAVTMGTAPVSIRTGPVPGGLIPAWH